MCVGRANSGLSFSSYKGTNPIMGLHSLMTSFRSNYLPKAPPPNFITLSVRASTYEFWENTDIQPMILHSNVVGKEWKI